MELPEKGWPVSGSLIVPENIPARTAALGTVVVEGAQRNPLREPGAEQEGPVLDNRSTQVDLPFVLEIRRPLRSEEVPRHKGRAEELVIRHAVQLVAASFGNHVDAGRGRAVGRGVDGRDVHFLEELRVNLLAVYVVDAVGHQRHRLAVGSHTAPGAVPSCIPASVVTIVAGVG